MKHKKLTTRPKRNLGGPGRSKQPSSHVDVLVSTKPWKACRLLDERSGNSYIGIDFPHNLGSQEFEIIESDLSESPAKVRVRLKQRGAALAGSVREQIDFVKRLLDEMPPTPMILAMKPGFRDDGFILGKRMLGSAKGRYRSRRSHHFQQLPQIGDLSGGPNAWIRDVGIVAKDSSFLMFALCLGLASSLPGYLREKTKTGSAHGPLLTETAVFNFSGESSTGKTTLGAAALGLFGPPGLIEKWDFSRRGLEELAESYNDLLLVLDDTEKHVEGSLTFKTALRYVNQIIPSGKSKALSASSQLPSLTWSTFGLTSSPKPLAEIAAEVGWNRSEGEMVRWIDITLPSRNQGGIFDQIAVDGESSTQLITKLEKGVAQNYGGVFPLWIKHLLAEDCSARLSRAVETFVRKNAPNGDSWRRRFAAKFGIVFAAGREAVRAGIVPWTPKEVRFAAVRCYRRAVEAIDTDSNAAEEFLTSIAQRVRMPGYFPRVSKGTEVIALDEPVIGISTEYKGTKVIGIRDETLIRLTGGRNAAEAVVELLNSNHLRPGGHGHALTTQLSVTISIGDKQIAKPRFWLIDVDRLMQWRAGKQQQRQHDR